MELAYNCDALLKVQKVYSYQVYEVYLALEY